ncbi:hypothetical protein hbim_01466 [Mycolicibacterium mageritense]|uniref:Uncharacterized protein n=1 Tax=Mycolicibacterium mageritense TaxID=53462 RepID=A0AAI8TS47_MYCME|nr:hypothetical protein hbim_01466 [Mycolicibacterium mageritense]
MKQFPRTCRSGRHVLHTTDDVRPDGACIHCSRENQRRYMRSLVDARHKLAAIEAALA